MNPLTQQGIAALKLGDRTAARQLLAAAIKQDPRDVTAWLWLAGATEREEEQIDCLRYVLKIDPQNQAAARGLAQLLEHRTASQAQSPAAPAAAPTAPPPDPTPVQAEPEPAPPLPPAEAPPAAFSEAPSAPPSIDSLRGSFDDSPQPVDVEAPETTTAPEGLPAEFFAAENLPTAQPALDTFREDFQFIEEVAEGAAEEPTQEAGVEPSYEARAEATVVTAEVTADETAQVTADEQVSPLSPEETSAPLLAPLPVRRRARHAEEEAPRVIFRSRPSLVPALICFWLFLFGAFGVAVLLNETGTVGLLLAAGLGLILELVVLYVVIRGLAERYELTNQQLTLRFRGKRARIPIAHIFDVGDNQSFFQRLLGIGNIHIDAAVGGQLTHIRLRNIPQYRQRRDQILNLLNDHD